MAHGFMYQVVLMDWYSWYLLAWRLSNALDADFCVEALEVALKKRRPNVFNTDWGS
jgi:putative transposase